MTATAAGSARATPRRTRPLARPGRLLEIDPDLAAGLSPDDFTAARWATVVPIVRVSAGEWDARALRRVGAFAVMVVDGLLVRDLTLVDRVAAQILGPGDVLTLGPEQTSHPLRCGAPAPTEIAVLDERLLVAAHRWPALLTGVLERAGRWADRALEQQAISQLGRVETRILAVLWHLAERWGRVRPDGVYVALKLTHEALGRLTGAQRPTVSLALKQLRAEGLVEASGQGWLLDHAGRAQLESRGEPVVSYKHVAPAVSKPSGDGGGRGGEPGPPGDDVAPLHATAR